MRHILLLLAAVVAVSAGVSSCIDDDITSAPSARLAFSTDTLSFDTVFTGQGSPTARLLVFNRGKKGVSISQISVKGGDEYFRLNVDGQSGSVFRDVEIRGEDSIYVFVECLLPENQQKEPYLIEDELEFVTNGNQQSVLLEAYGQNVTRLRGVEVASDLTLSAERPYVVFDSLVVEPGATLRVEPGAQLLFHDKAYMRIKGRLLARGTAEKKIHMRGDRLDNVLPDVGYDILAGQWRGIRIDAESFGNELAYVDMRSTSQGLALDSCGNLEQRKLLLENSWLHNSQSSALSSSHAWVDAYGCCFSEAAGNVVSLTGGRHTFVQCTLSNYYLFAAPVDAILGLYHTGGEDARPEEAPFMKADFLNCIVYGMPADINIGDLKGTEVYMRNVLFRSAGEDDEHFIGCLWDADPLFYTVREEYLFNYRVKAESPAIGAGNAAFLTPECASDMDGNRRDASGAPTLGAYEYVPAVEEE